MKELIDKKRLIEELEYLLPKNYRTDEHLSKFFYFLLRVIDEQPTYRFGKEDDD